MIAATHKISASLHNDSRGEDLPLAVLAAEVTLDEAWAPYAQARLTVALPGTSDDADLIDPRDDVRVTIELSGAGTRAFDLGLRDRRINAARREISLELASDEALLQDSGLVTTNPSIAARPHEASLRAILTEVVLPTIGAQLEPGEADYDATIDYDVTNLHPNPGGELNTAHYSDGTSTEVITRSTAMARTGAASIAVLITAGSGGSVFLTDTSTYPMQATPGKTYTAAVWVRATVASAAQMRIRWLTSANATIADVFGTLVSVTTTGWTLVTVTAVAPLTTAKIAPIIRLNGTSGSSFYMDDTMVNEGELAPAFNGDTPDTAIFEYAWMGTPHASASTRTGRYRRSADSLTWSPGETAWDFIEPLVQASGLRLWCDEARRWWLTDPSAADSGQINLTEGINLTEAEDRISRDEAWYESVVIEYRWLEAGAQWVKYDAAGTGGRCLTLTYERPWPGPGAAAAVLHRARGRGRVLAVSALSQYRAAPGQTLQATLPGTPVQTGVISSVAWRFPEQQMTVGSRGLTDTSPTAWIQLAEGEQWIDSPPGESWIEEVA